MGTALRPPLTHACPSDHLAMMIELLGEIPKHVLSRGYHTAEFFDPKGTLAAPPPC